MSLTHSITHTKGHRVLSSVCSPPFAQVTGKKVTCFLVCVLCVCIQLCRSMDVLDARIR